MVKTTRKQREAIKKVYDRKSPDTINITYRQFRKRAVPTIGCDNAVAIPWCHMWLCIETDGYTHS